VRRGGGETRRLGDAAADRTLLRLIRESGPPTVKLGTIRATLEFGIKLRKIHDQQARIVAVEAQLTPGTTPGPRNRELTRRRAARCRGGREPDRGATETLALTGLRAEASETEVLA
jgi:hypothetical protein